MASVQPQPQATRKVVLLTPWDSPSGKGREWEKRAMESNNSLSTSLRETVQRRKCAAEKEVDSGLGKLPKLGNRTLTPIAGEPQHQGGALKNPPKLCSAAENDLLHLQFCFRL